MADRATINGAKSYAASEPVNESGTLPVRDVRRSWGVLRVLFVPRTHIRRRY